MNRADAAGKRKILDIDRGLFLVRYSDAEDGEQSPIVRVSLDRDTAGDNFIVSHPDADEAILSMPGTSLVVRAVTPVKLLVEVMPRRAHGSTAATVKVEALNAGDLHVAPSAASERLDEIEADVDGLRVHGHIAGQGDVVVDRNAWLAGPAAPSRVEGIMIEWPDRPRGIDIRYAVRFAQPNAAQSQMTEMGKFAGTRGRALPLTGVVLELSGDEADPYTLSVEALFLGSPAVRATGQRVVLNGPTGRETLVGLRVNLQRAAKAGEIPAPVALRDKSSGKVRVFKGRQKTDQPTA